MIIGISGKARSGKDTFAEMLAEALNKVKYPPYVMMAFANELKLKCQEAFDLTWEQLWGDDKEVPDERYPKPLGAGGKGFWTAREIMQNFGAFYRTIDNEFWIKNLFRVAEDKEYTNVIVTDVRYINEADYIIDQGGAVIRVERDNKDDVHNMQHPSEVELDNYKRFDFTISNNGTLDQLRASASDTIRFIETGMGTKLKEIKIDG
jgi:hypothetical protein